MEAVKLSLIEQQLKVRDKRIEIKNYMSLCKHSHELSKETQQNTLDQLKYELNLLVVEKDSLLCQLKRDSLQDSSGCDCCVDFGKVSLPIDLSETCEDIQNTRNVKDIGIYCFEKL